MFSRVIAQGIFPSPIQPSGASGILRFDVGIGGTGVAIDENASWWTNSTANNISVSNYLGVPRLIVSKGLSIVTITGSYAQVYGSDGKIIGGTLVTTGCALVVCLPFGLGAAPTPVALVITNSTGSLLRIASVRATCSAA